MGTWEVVRQVSKILDLVRRSSHVVDPFLLKFLSLAKGRICCYRCYGAEKCVGFLLLLEVRCLLSCKLRCLELSWILQVSS